MANLSKERKDLKQARDLARALSKNERLKARQDDLNGSSAPTGNIQDQIKALANKNSSTKTATKQPKPDMYALMKAKGPLGFGIPTVDSAVKGAFDLVSRTGYASANEVLGKVTRTKDAFSKGPIQGLGQLAKESSTIPTDLNRPKDVWAGLSGKKKTSYSQVLTKLGVSPKIAAVAGIPLDIGLDPSSYVTFGMASEAHLGSRATQVAERTAGIMRKTTELVDKGMTMNAARATAEKLASPLASRQLAMKTNKGVVILGSDDIFTGATKLKNALLKRNSGKIATIENVSKIAPVVEDVIKTVSKKGIPLIPGAAKFDATKITSYSPEVKAQITKIQARHQLNLSNLTREHETALQMFESKVAEKLDTKLPMPEIPGNGLIDNTTDSGLYLAKQHELKKGVVENRLASTRKKAEKIKLQEKYASISSAQTKLIDDAINAIDTTAHTTGLSEDALKRAVIDQREKLTQRYTSQVESLKAAQDQTLVKMTDKISGFKLPSTDVTAPNINRLPVEKPILVQPASKLAEPVIDFKQVDKQLGITGSEKVFQKLDEVRASVLTDPNALDSTSKFKTSVNMPVGTKERLQRLTNGGLKQHELDVSTVRDNFSALTRTEDIQVRKAVETGTRDSYRNIALEKDPTRNLGEFIDQFDSINKQIFDQEVASGARDALKTPYDPNYVYMSLPGGEKPIAKQQFKQARKKEIYAGEQLATPGLANAARDARINTVEAAKTAGLTPLEGASAVLQARIGKSYSDITKHQFARELVDNLGVEPLTARGVLAAKAQGLVELTPGSNKFVIPEAKKAMDYMLEMQSNARFAKANAKLLTDAMGLWKLTQTAIRPGSHITNGIGDITTAMIGGISSPRPFLQSYSIMRHDGKSIVKSFIDGKMTAAEIEHSFITQGANTGQQLVENREIINSLGGKVSSIPYKIVNSKPAHAVRKFAENREEFPRLATYIDELDKSAARGLTKEQAIKSATIRTIKYHFDYSDLTPFEKNLRRTVVPFYTFMRKNTPLMLQSILTKPGRIAAVPKAFNGMEKFLGTDQPGALDTIKGPFQGLYDLTKSNPQGDNYTFDPKLGITDALKVVDDPLQQLLGSLGPVTKEIQQMGGKTPAGLPAGSFKDQILNETWLTRMYNDATTGKKSGSEQALAAFKNVTGLGIQKNKGKSKLYDLKKENGKIAKELKAKLLEEK